MSISRAEFAEICNLVCPECGRGTLVRYRPETCEYVHDRWNRTTMTHSLCWANGFRKSIYAVPTDPATEQNAKPQKSLWQKLMGLWNG